MPVSLSFESTENECASSVNKTSGSSPSYPFSLRYLSIKFCANFLFAFYILLNVLEHSWL